MTKKDEPTPADVMKAYYEALGMYAKVTAKDTKWKRVTFERNGQIFHCLETKIEKNGEIHTLWEDENSLTLLGVTEEQIYGY